MTVVTEKDELGRERVVATDSTRTIMTVEGTVQRITGAGKLVVQPVTKDAAIRVGNRVTVYTSEKVT